MAASGRWGGAELALADLIGRVKERAGARRLLRVQGGAGAFLVSRLRAEHAGPIVVMSPTTKRAERFAEELRTFLPGAAPVHVLPRHDTAPFDRFSPHPEGEARRMSLLYALLAADDSTPLTLVAPWSALLRRVPPRSELRTRVTHLERGMSVDRDALLQVLVAAGYQRVGLVEERGEVAARGGILDLFPPQLAWPVRLEFEFEQIGSIRHFDPATQRSQEELRACVAIPPRAYRIPHDLDALLQRVRGIGRERRVPESNIYAVTEPLARRHAPPGIENLEALLHDELETLFDYVPQGALLVVDDPETGRARARAYTEEIFEAHARATSQDRLVCDPLELYTTDDTAWDAVVARRPLLLDPLGILGGSPLEEAIEVRALAHAELRREIERERGSGRAMAPLAVRLRNWTAAGHRVRISCPSLSAADRLADILADYDCEIPIAGRDGAVSWEELPEPGRSEICVSPLREGFEFSLERLVVVTEEDIFGTRVHRRAPRITRTGQPIDRLAQIEEGDHLVHAEHGIGAYGGLIQLGVGGVTQEFLLLHYGGGDKLYLPIYRLGQVQRYSGSDGAAALDRLGGQRWVRTKRRVRKAVREMAQELVAIYAAREVLEGRAHPAPGADYEEFEARFPYEDTVDQRRSTVEVLEDLQRARPMDRLVCGDVGFGKTEVACRAAYIVASEGRQVAFLVPTTVLCQQHFQTLRERFASTPIEVAALSRMSAPADLRRTLERITSGRVDIVIGTHRLLSKDVRFRDLGLLLIDEEHRFGVADKEKLKQMRKLVDALTLTATPIPRTLQMALSGIRDLSLIATPPPDRMAIRTEVTRLSDELVREAILREMRRGGQVFFVHNRVETIREFEQYLRELVPEARIGVAHGQMPAHTLEKAMIHFLEKDWDVLLCTAIIESGLDIPNANTILIHRADRFGLAQLYQLRGRVGRSDRRAYAYLFLPPEGSLTEDGRRRIEAIQDLSELGAGFRLATHDLEIRGAGNFLGAEQSGHIAAVGYELYMEMLDQAIGELRGQGGEDQIEPEIRLPVAALLPEAYVPSVNQRLGLYKQLSQARDDAELAEIRADLLDRFGPLPSESEALLEVIRLKIRCRDLGILSLDTAGGALVLQVSARSRIDPRQLVGLLDKPGTPFRVTPDRKIFLDLRLPEDALAESFGLLELLAPDTEKAEGAQHPDGGSA